MFSKKGGECSKDFSLNYISRNLIDSNEIRTHSHLVRKRTLNHLAKLVSFAKWLSVRLRTMWLWVRNSLLSIKLQTWHLHLLLCTCREFFDIQRNYRVWIHFETRTLHHNRVIYQELCHQKF